MLTTEPTDDLARAGSDAPEAAHSEGVAEGGRPERHVARVRSCVGCGERIEAEAGRDAAVRLVLAPEAGARGSAEIAVDAAGGAFGRGAHLHPRPDCIEKAARRGLARSFKCAVRMGDAAVSPKALADAIEEAYARRTTGLLASARRARALVVGSDSVTQAWRQGEARLVVVAADAQAAAHLSEVQAAIKQGLAVVWGDKSTLGPLVGSGDREVAVLAITERRLADAVARAIQIRESCRAVTDGAARPTGGNVQGKTSRKLSDSNRSGSELPAVERGE